MTSEPVTSTDTAAPPSKFLGEFGLPALASPADAAALGPQVKMGSVLDVETTGMSVSRDRVIEVAIRTFFYHAETGSILATGPSYEGLQDPGRELPAEIVRLTGIRDEDLRGRKVDWARVRELLDASELVLAHNASFDRPFVENELGGKVARPWACTARQVRWRSKGFPGGGLVSLSRAHGFFVDAHRAMNDVNATLKLMTLTDPGTGKAYFAELMANAYRRQLRVIAAGSPFEKKDLLKARRYRWNPERRFWHRVVYENELAGEIAWLEAMVYGGAFRGTIREIPLTEHYSRYVEG